MSPRSGALRAWSRGRINWIMRTLALIAISAAVVLPTRDERASIPQGKIAFVRTGEHGRDVGEIYLMNPDGRGVRNLTRHRGDDQWQRWSPDGSRILFVRQERNRTHVYVMNADGSRVRRLARSEYRDSAAWSPDGRRIAFLRLGAPYVIRVDGTGVRRVTRGRSFDDPGALEWSAAGKLAFIDRVGASATVTWTVNADGSALRRLTRNRLGDEGLAWSPSGDRLAVVRRRAGRLDVVAAVFVVDADGGPLRRVTPWGPVLAYAKPAWSPEGGKIAFVGRNDDLYSIRSDGRDIRRLARGGRSGVQAPTWSPDGRRLAFTRHPAIFVVNASGTRERRLVPRPGRPPFSHGENWLPQWSPSRPQQ